MMGSHRVCGARCHKAKHAACGCWCGGLFHGEAGKGAREAFAQIYGRDPTSVEEGSLFWKSAIAAAEYTRAEHERARLLTINAAHPKGA